MSDVATVFDRFAAIYDRSRRQLVPCFDDLYGTLLELIPADCPPSFRVLDLGAGTGLLSLLILERFPAAELTLVDVSEEMLARVRERFAGRPGRVQLVVADYAARALWPAGTSTSASRSSEAASLR